jgi:hypothetical protein
VAFHRNGEPATLGGSTAKSSVRTVIEKSKLFSSVSEQPAAGVEPSIRAAFDKVVKGLVLNLLLDLQREERL